MRAHWDERARADAFRYIASWRRKWSPQEFFASGEAEYTTRIQPLLDRFGLDPSKAVAVDVGCGIGRVTIAMARRFAHVYGVDISPEMLRQAREYAGDARVSWLLSSGSDLGGLRPESVDFVFSLLVLQHIPRRVQSLALIREMLGVLKPGGLFLFQFNSRMRPTMNVRGRILWRAIDLLRDRGTARAENAARLVAKFAAVDVLEGGSTWRGAILDPQWVLETVWGEGGLVAGLEGWGTQMTWCFGEKRRWTQPA